MTAARPVPRVPLGELLLRIEAGASIRTTERIARKDEPGVLKVSALTWGAFDPNEAKAVDPNYLPEPHHRVRKGDVLISRANTAELVGAVVRVGEDHPNRLLSDKTLRLVLDESRCHPEYLVNVLRLPEVRAHLEENATGTSSSMRNITQDTIRATLIPLPDVQCQEDIAHRLQTLSVALSQAKTSLSNQLNEILILQKAIIERSLVPGVVNGEVLADVLTEIIAGVGPQWRSRKVLGATRAGLAPARERPGKNGERYKPVDAGTVFYNPMRILIGSIAFVDDDDEPGITSPDYVVLKGKPGVVDSRWFYYWLRSPFGERCIQSLARGAVRERMLFSRLAEGEIELPDYDTQVKASQALKQIKPLRAAIRKQLDELELLPQKLLAQVFEG